MGLLQELYQHTIIDHDRRPRNYGEPASYSHSQEGLNPSCGDEVTLYLQVEDGQVRGASFVGQGCAISRAAASMMTGAVRGRSVTEALELAGKFRTMIHGGEVDPALGDLQALQGVSQLHARVKCATLPWVTLEQALTAA